MNHTLEEVSTCMNAYICAKKNNKKKQWTWGQRCCKLYNFSCQAMQDIKKAFFFSEAFSTDVDESKARKHT